MIDLRISSPCAAEWNDMSPVAGGRHCSLCAKTVVDLTCLGTAERERELARITTLVQGGNRVCIRTAATRDGRVLNASRRILTGGMAAMLAMTVAGCQDAGSDSASTSTGATSAQSHEIPVRQGEVHAPPPTTGKVVMGDVMMPPKIVKPVAPDAAQ